MLISFPTLPLSTEGKFRTTVACAVCPKHAVPKLAKKNMAAMEATFVGITYRREVNQGAPTIGLFELRWRVHQREIGNVIRPDAEFEGIYPTQYPLVYKWKPYQCVLVTQLSVWWQTL